MSDVDAILDSGNLDDIDALLDAVSASDNESDAVAKFNERGDTGREPADKPSQDELAEPAAAPAAAAPKEAPAPAVAEPEAPPVVKAKDGKHEIPFSVLEKERRQTAELTTQLNDQARENALLKAQLAKHNITPKQLPEQVTFSEERLAELEGYGEIGEAVAILAQQNAALMAQLRTREQPDVMPEEPANPVASNPDLLRWSSNDTHWKVAEGIDETLQSEPEWVGKSLAERIPEIVLRTKLALREPSTLDSQSIDQKAADALNKATRSAPNSLTDVGGEVPGSVKTVAEQLSEGDALDVHAYMEKMMAKGMTADEAMATVL